MRSMNIREEKAGVSALVDTVEHGETITTTKYGKPAAVIIPLDVAANIIPQKPNFAEFLMSVPTDFDIITIKHLDVNSSSSICKIRKNGLPSRRVDHLSLRSRSPCSFLRNRRFFLTEY
ncbi:type II toxin-antitoxin system Phd/YefM family antitoxin [Brucella pituitosa]|uniref:type II toxin-antitoxin system Phd/YefM family antitoxin n=1 Tax=Brucella pituitosa TaxID=571256 RepID=UPI003F4AE993